LESIAYLTEVINKGGNNVYFIRQILSGFIHRTRGGIITSAYGWATGLGQSAVASGYCRPGIPSWCCHKQKKR